MRIVLFCLLLTGCIHQQSSYTKPSSKELVCRGLNCCWNANDRIAVCSAGDLQGAAIMVRVQN